jgi:hypothetical protein
MDTSIAVEEEQTAALLKLPIADEENQKQRSLGNCDFMRRRVQSGKYSRFPQN